MQRPGSSFEGQGESLVPPHTHESVSLLLWIHVIVLTHPPTLMMFSSALSLWCSVAAVFWYACAVITPSIFTSIADCLAESVLTAVRMVSRSEVPVGSQGQTRGSARLYQVHYEQLVRCEKGVHRSPPEYVYRYNMSKRSGDTGSGRRVRRRRRRRSMMRRGRRMRRIMKRRRGTRRRRMRRRRRQLYTVAPC